MQVLIVHCHPEPTSYNRALTGVAAAALRRSGHTVEISDLYAEGFDPVEGSGHYRALGDHEHLGSGDSNHNLSYQPGKFW